MQDHADDPAWLNKYETKLISHHMILADPAYPYGSVLEGSHIVVSGMCISFVKLAGPPQEGSGFHLACTLDKSPVFHCSCCNPRPGEERKAAREKFMYEADHHICMVVMGDAWRVGEEYDRHDGICDLVVLRAYEEEGTYERVGFVRVQKEWFGSAKTIPEMHEIWDGLGWERRELKLI